MSGRTNVAFLGHTNVAVALLPVAQKTLRHFNCGDLSYNSKPFSFKTFEIEKLITMKCEEPLSRYLGLQSKGCEFKPRHQMLDGY